MFFFSGIFVSVRLVGTGCGTYSAVEIGVLSAQSKKRKRIWATISKLMKSVL